MGVWPAFKVQSPHFPVGRFGHNPVWVVRRAAFAVYERSISFLSPLLSNAAHGLNSETQMTLTSLNL